MLVVLLLFLLLLEKTHVGIGQAVLLLWMEFYFSRRCFIGFLHALNWHNVLLVVERFLDLVLFLLTFLFLLLIVELLLLQVLDLFLREDVR